MIFRAFVGVNLRNCTLLHMYVLSARPVGQLRIQLAHEGLLLVVLFKARSGRNWTDAETLDESWFSRWETPFHGGITGLKLLLKFSSLFTDTLYTALFFWKDLFNHWMLVFFLPMFIFFKKMKKLKIKKKMYSQNEAGVLQTLENKIFFTAQPWWEDLYRIL